VRQCTLHHVGCEHAGQRMRRENDRPGIHTDGTMRMPRAASGIGVRASHCEHSTTTVPLRRGAAEKSACRPSLAGGLWSIGGATGPNNASRGLRRAGPLMAFGR
jgi:hypothetical protein